MKLKYYLRGMGIGIVVTTVILMIVFALHKNETLTDDQIRERAAALGMVMPDAASNNEKLSDPVTDDGNDTASDQETAAEGAASDQKDVSAAQTPAAKPQNSGKEASGTTEKSDQTDKTDTSGKNNVETIEQVEVSIVGGEYSDDVCKKLKRAGIIDDADDFNKYLSDGGYDSLLQPGTYIIPKDADYDTIIKMITTKNDDKKTDQTKGTKSKK